MEHVTDCIHEFLLDHSHKFPAMRSCRVSLSSRGESGIVRGSRISQKDSKIPTLPFI